MPSDFLSYQKMYPYKRDTPAREWRKCQSHNPFEFSKPKRFIIGNKFYQYLQVNISSQIIKKNTYHRQKLRCPIVCLLTIRYLVEINSALPETLCRDA
jgi:hypothetical protein